MVEDPERRKAFAKASLARQHQLKDDPTFRSQQRASLRRYRESHADQLRESSRKYEEQNAEDIRSRKAKRRGQKILEDAVRIITEKNK